MHNESSPRMSSTSCTDPAPVLSTSTGNYHSDDDIIMTKEHKHTLRENRDCLVENMYPDDMMNRLQSRKVLTERDVNRVKEKGNVDSMNECLLDIIIRKPDRAYMELVDALREDGQSHLANVLQRRDDTPRKGRKQAADGTRSTTNEEGSPQMMSRKRKAAVGVRLRVEEEEEDEELEMAATPKKYKSREDVLTAQINDEILETSLIELRNLKQLAKGGVSASTVNSRKRILKTLTQLQRFRREVLGVYEGSVVFWVFCPTVTALDDLWRIFKNGSLRRIFTSAFVEELNLRRVKISVYIDVADYIRCRHFLLENYVYNAAGNHCCNDDGKDYEFKENTPEPSPEDIRIITRAQKKAYMNMTPLQRFAGKHSISDCGGTRSRRSSSGVSSSSLTRICSTESSPYSESTDPACNLCSFEADDYFKLQTQKLSSGCL